MPVGRSASVVGLCGAMLIAGCGGISAAGGEFDPSGATGGDETENFESQPARGISILEVEVNQGTRVPIGVGGDWIDESERLAHLIGSRDSLMRVHYTVDDGWVPREIEARLTLDFPDGSSKSFTDQRMIEGDSDPKNFDGPFHFDLAADAGETAAGTLYRVELWERSAGGEALDEGVWANPVEGSQAIGFEAMPMQLDVVLVPLTYQDITANLDETTTQMLLDNLYEQNPTTEIIYDVHDPVLFEDNLFELASVLPFLATLRSSENAAPNVYYHAFVDVGSTSVAGQHGISGIANDTEGDAGNRVSVTVLWTPDPSLAADTFTHETGHAQGLSHVGCAEADAAETDPNYPYADGHIGNWGYGIRRLSIFDPEEAYDYMSYCGPSWVSDWTWNKTYQRIQTLTSWDGADGGAPPEQLLVVSESADGRRQWWTMPGTIDPERVDGRDRIELETSSGEVVEVLADVSTLSDGRTRWIRAAVPSELEMSELSQIRHVRGGEVSTISVGDVGVTRPSTFQPAWKRHRSTHR